MSYVDDWREILKMAVFSRLMVPVGGRFLANVFSVPGLGMMSVFLGKLQWPLHFRTWPMLKKRSSPRAKPSAFQFRRLIDPQLSDFRKIPRTNELLGWEGTVLRVIGTLCKFSPAFPGCCCAAGKLLFSSHLVSIPKPTLSNQLDCPAPCFGPADLWGPFKMLLLVDVTFL